MLVSEVLKFPRCIRTARIRKFAPFVAWSHFVFQNSMNLPPDKVRLLRSYDNEKKWELICDQVGPLFSYITQSTEVISKLLFHT